jgi:hypothetical protein
VAGLEIASVAMLNALGLRADSVGHVILTQDEVRFARSSEGQRWLQPIDADMSLYKLTQQAKDLGLVIEHRPRPGAAKAKPRR